MKYPVSISLFCLLILLPFNCESKLLVRGPSSIKEQFDAYNGLDYYVVTPKDAPQNKRIVGSLVLSNPITGCSDISANTPELFEVQNPILVMQKGDCAFPQKAQNAEVAGARMVIIISDHDLAPNHQIEREYQYPVGIETVIVSKTDGDRLLSYIQTETEDPLYNEPIDIVYSVDVDRHINYQRKSQNVMLDYWFASADFNGDSYKTLRVLKEILEEFGDRVTFNPHYVLWQASSESEGFNQPDPRCVSGGRYCDPEPLADSPLSGSKGVMETLRQICLRSFESKVSSGGFWWTYLKKLINYSEVCGTDQSEGMSCHEATRMITSDDMLANNVKEMVDQCVRESFGGIDVSQYNGGLELAVDNTLLSKELELQTQTGLVHYPSIYVNDRRYMDMFSSKEAIKDFICGHFEDGYAPVACTKTTLYSVAPGNNSNGSFFTYFLMVLGCCVFMVVLVYCVRRSVKRQIMKEMDHEVSAIISQYAQLKDQQNVDGEQV